MNNDHARHGSRLTYILPIKMDDPSQEEELDEYLQWLDERTQLIVVDGSEIRAFQRHVGRWPGIEVIAPNPAMRTKNGKVWGVLTGLALARNDKVIVADDDIRYDSASLTRIEALLDEAEVVRPQNYFRPSPWHAKWDSARSLINRCTGGDWPGTLGVRRSAIPDGYEGNCLFENLEMVRTVVAGGGRERVAQNLYIRRLPPSTGHFFSQRVRQAYDEWARPGRLVLQLTFLPALVFAAFKSRPVFAAMLGCTIACAEVGRRIAGGRRYFDLTTSLMAPCWLVERAVCAWLALGLRIVRGGAIYHGSIIARPATPLHELRRRREHAGAAEVVL